MRKRCKRKVYAVGGTPVTFSLRKADVERGNLMIRASLDAVLDHTGDADHVAGIASVGIYCVGMCVRLERDGSVDTEQLQLARDAVAAGADAIAAVQARLEATGKIGCTGPEREALKRLVDVAEEFDKVATRRQAYDVAMSLFGGASVSAAELGEVSA